jgi:hypothetical protein
VKKLSQGGKVTGVILKVSDDEPASDSDSIAGKLTSGIQACKSAPNLLQTTPLQPPELHSHHQWNTPISTSTAQPPAIYTHYKHIHSL